VVTELLQGKIPKKKESLFKAFWQLPPKAWRAGMACGHGARACFTWIVKFLTTWIEQKKPTPHVSFLAKHVACPLGHGQSKRQHQSAKDYMDLAPNKNYHGPYCNKFHRA